MTRYTLSDGTDISRKTVDQIKAAQQRADQEFFAKARKKSPAFPTVNETLERRRQLRETIAARTLGVLGLVGLVVAAWDSFGWVMAGVGFIGFIVTCFAAGNRQYVKQGTRQGNRGQRPF